MNLLILLVVIIIIAVLFGLLYKYKLGGDEKDDLIKKLCEETGWIISEGQKYTIQHRDYNLDNINSTDTYQPPERIIDCQSIDTKSYDYYLHEINSLNNAFLLYMYYIKKYPGSIKSNQFYISVYGKLPSGSSFEFEFNYINFKSNIKYNYGKNNVEYGHSKSINFKTIEDLIDYLSDNEELKIDREEFYQIPTKVPNITLPDTDIDYNKIDEDFDPLS